MSERCSGDRCPGVAIIILNWNGWRDTIDCVESCLELTWPNFRIILVDNGSTDGSEALLRGRFPELEIIQTGANLGFAGGNNVGIRRAVEQGAEYLWLINNDAVVHPEALTELVRAMETNPRAAIAGSLIYYHHEPDRIWSAGGAWERGRLRLRQRGANERDLGQYQALCEVGSVSGCSMMVSSTAAGEIGLMEESYFLYWEDTEWCARAQKEGFRVIFVPGSRVWHKVSASVGGHSEHQYYYLIRNGLLFCRKYDLLSLPVLLLYVTADVTVGLLRGRWPMFRGFCRGVADFLRCRRGRRAFSPAGRAPAVAAGPASGGGP